MSVKPQLAGNPWRPLFTPQMTGCYVNDHSVLRTGDGRWHVIGITKMTPEMNSDAERYFCHGSGRSLAAGGFMEHWKACDFGNRAWAPSVVFDGQRYVMLYGPGLLRAAVCHDDSLDHWLEVPCSVSGCPPEGNLRDQMVTRLDADTWLMYATALYKGRGAVSVFVSEDLFHWRFVRHAWRTAPSVTRQAPWSAAESPFLFRHAGHYFLSVTYTTSMGGPDEYHNTLSSDRPIRSTSGPTRATTPRRSSRGFACMLRSTFAILAAASGTLQPAAGPARCFSRPSRVVWRSRSWRGWSDLRGLEYRGAVARFARHRSWGRRNASPPPSHSMKTIKKLIPWRLKSAVKTALQQYWLRRGVDALSRLESGELPTRDMLEALRRGWGNCVFGANIDYLEEVAKHAAVTAGPILECGSGLTTLLLGMLAGRRGVQVRSLEHSPEWHQRICAVLTQHRIANVEVLCSPLRDYGDFSWYDPPLEKLPDHFRLVVCDGPPGTTKGGRYGLLPILGARLHEGAVILLDDAGRAGEAEIIKQWQQRVGLTVEIFNRPAGTFATLVKRS